MQQPMKITCNQAILHVACGLSEQHNVLKHTQQSRVRNSVTQSVQFFLFIDQFFRNNKMSTTHNKEYVGAKIVNYIP